MKSGHLPRASVAGQAIATPRSLLRIWAVLGGLMWALIGCGQPTAPLAPAQAPTPTDVCRATVHLKGSPTGALVSWDGQPAGALPTTLIAPEGEHTLGVASPGFEALARSVSVSCAEQTLDIVLVDATPPTVELVSLPTVVRSEEGLKVIARAQDGSGVVAMRLELDGKQIYAIVASSLRHNLDTRPLAPGAHVLTVWAQDGAGNQGRAEGQFTVASLAPTATPLPTPSLAPQATVTNAPSPAPTLRPTQPVERVLVVWGERVLSAYAYEEALYYPEGSALPYPALHHDRVGAPRPRTYRTIVMHNAYLELTLLPELGGRIYSARFLPTGQELFYQNSVIKPTHWGPTDQGWWLAVGGMEWCLPVDEHGYVTAEPWEASIATGADGSATVTMALIERSRNIEARVAITLRPREAAIHVGTSLRNPDAQPKEFQYWMNAMLSPGSHGIQPSLRFHYPTQQVIVHSRGDQALPDAHGALPWPIYGGRDLSNYATWRDWLGFFVPDLTANYTAIYDEQARLGLVRAFPPQARGAKLFGFGLGFGDSGAYSDDGAQYAEMWGGWTPTFWDWATLPAHGEVAWDETWWALAQCDGLSVANERAALWAQRTASGIQVVVAAPTEAVWGLELTAPGAAPSRSNCTVAPSAPCRAEFAIGGNAPGPLGVRIVGSDGRPILETAVE